MVDIPSFLIGSVLNSGGGTPDPNKYAPKATFITAFDKIFNDTMWNCTASLYVENEV